MISLPPPPLPYFHFLPAETQSKEKRWRENNGDGVEYHHSSRWTFQMVYGKMIRSFLEVHPKDRDLHKNLETKGLPWQQLPHQSPCQARCRIYLNRWTTIRVKWCFVAWLGDHLHVVQYPLGRYTVSQVCKVHDEQKLRGPMGKNNTVILCGMTRERKNKNSLLNLFSNYFFF